ncbi:PBP1A family penicillin-binding protein [Sandarakinorhabdus sp.]|uniref:transglycosylase domain-containing protein n=1 Tax=Sandarakinorhabdus sp. TaxID=1916663 RepID=UPI00286E0782|nr:PBP1A family penicillin-binding protein [Sandarakinorhabdus sp.]
MTGLSASSEAPPEVPPRTRWQRIRRWLVPGMAIAAGLFTALVVWLVVTTPLGRALEPAKSPALVLTDSEGRPIARRGDYKEAPIEIAKLPKYVPAALVAIEDRRFYDHMGVDPVGIMRALFANARAGGVSQGGSTLTQQFAKTSFLTAERSIRRKLQEVIIALYVEQRLTKDEILERYLSSVYFGDGAFGIRAAARVYFDTTPEELTLGEAAMLAGLVQAPSRLAPSRHLKDARERAALVLAAMVDTGAITAAEAKKAVPARYVPGRKSLPTGSYFADWVLPQARDAMTETAYGEIIVRTTLDHDLQKLAERAVKDALAGAQGLNVSQAALVAMRPDGTVVAMVGGTDYKTSSFNRATQAQRQPGSSFKLFVYLAALDAGLTPGDIVEDTPIVIGDYAPKNDDLKYRGPISLATAFAASSNVAAVRLGQMVGVPAVAAQVRKLGITGGVSLYPAMALGTTPITLVDMTRAYAALASGKRPVIATGLWKARPGEDPDEPREIEAMADPDAAAATWPSREPMLKLLNSAVRNGTGNKAALNIPTYGKTGTTQNHRDALFIGFAGDLVVGVWVGNDDNSPMAGSIVGGSLPARMWKRFMVDALTKEGKLPRGPSPEELLMRMENSLGADDTEAMLDAMDNVTIDTGDVEVTIDTPLVPDEPPPIEAQ